MRVLERVSHSLVDLAFPPRCLACGVAPDSTDARFCTECATAIDKDRRQRVCPRCAAAVAPYEVFDGTCSDCRVHPQRVMGTVRVGSYRSPLGQLIRAYKYRGREELQPLLGDWLAEAAMDAPWLDRVEAIVSVPTHWRRRLSRSIHPADPFAASVAARTELPHLSLLRRVRAGPSQIELSYTAREENVRGAFAMRRGVVLHDARILLVDDVRTTGATLNECARVLRRGGAKEVYAAVIVRVGFASPDSSVLSSI